MKTLTIAARFCGPATSSNGGYFAGLVATLASRTLAVRLLKPPPLDTELPVRELGVRRVQEGPGQKPSRGARPAPAVRHQPRTPIRRARRPARSEARTHELQFQA